MAKEHKEKKTPTDIANDYDKIMDYVNGEMGNGTIIAGNYRDKNIQVIPSGALTLDMAMGVGGYPKGRLVEIFGPESSGKSTMILHAIANAQKAGGVAALIDTEHSFDPTYAESIGVDIEKLLFSQPDNGENALRACEMLCKAGVSVIAIDSIAALIPKAVLEGEIGDTNIGGVARLLSGALPRLAAAASKSGSIIFMANQMREKIGVMFGSPETTPGGKALRFYTSIRLDIRRIKTYAAEGDKDNMIGNRTKVKVVKNKVSPPFRVAEFDIVFGKGIDYPSSIFEAGILAGVIEQTGSWYNFNGERLGNGKTGAISAIREHDNILTSLREKILGADVKLVPSIGSGDAEVAE